MKVLGVLIGLFKLFICVWAIALPSASAQSYSDGVPIIRALSDEGADVKLPSDGTLTIFVYPSSDPINYKSPSSALWSLFRIEVKRILLSRRHLNFTNNRGDKASLKIPYTSTIGHTIACISCTLSDRTDYLNWVSMSSYHYPDTTIYLLIKAKTGLGFLFHKYSDGVLIRDKENILRLVNYRGFRTKGHRGGSALIQPRYMRFPINAEACAAIKDMVDFYETFPQDQKNPGRETFSPSTDATLYFTSVLDPYDSYIHRQQTGQGDVGGGCAPFGVGLLKAGGLHIQEFDKIWKRQLTVSDNLIGKENTTISLWQILFGGLGKKWQHEGHSSRTLAIYDPELIWNFIGEILESSNAANTYPQANNSMYERTKWAQLAGIEVTPGEDITLFTPFNPLLTGTRNQNKRTKQTGNQEITIQGIYISKLITSQDKRSVKGIPKN